MVPRSEGVFVLCSMIELVPSDMDFCTFGLQPALAVTDKADLKMLCSSGSSEHGVNDDL